MVLGPSLEVWLGQGAQLGFVFASALVFQFIIGFGLGITIIATHYTARHDGHERYGENTRFKACHNMYQYRCLRQIVKF